MRDTAGEVRMNTLVTFFNKLLYSDVQSVGRSTRTYLEQLCTNTGYSIEDLSEATGDGDE